MNQYSFSRPWLQILGIAAMVPLSSSGLTWGLKVSIALAVGLLCSSHPAIKRMYSVFQGKALRVGAAATITLLALGGFFMLLWPPKPGQLIANEAMTMFSWCIGWMTSFLMEFFRGDFRNWQAQL